MHLLKSPKPTTALSPDYTALLARSFALHDNADETSRLRTLHDNHEALAWRISLIEQAEHSIDAQYYSWHLDTSGLLLIDKLLDAANRGVRVRVLLDDIHIFGIDRQIATLNRHRNIEVRIFNPFTYRSRFKLIRLLELLFKLSRLNHRMHNKLLVVDNLVTIIGGRNIGDEYMGLHASMMFRDLDLLLAGDCVEPLSASFDVFWNHPLSREVYKLIPLRTRARDFNHLRKRIKSRLSAQPEQIRKIELCSNRLATLCSPADLLPITAKVSVVSDAPEFDTTITKPGLDRLYQCSLQSREQIVFVSAYFIPDEGLLDTFQTLIQKGVRIIAYTNSLASIDVTAAFSGYQEYRQRLLDMGVELFEYRAEHAQNPGTRSALHAKCIVFDNNWVYVGTLNLDPRSAALNTEVGLLINSIELAQNINHSIQAQQSLGEYWQLIQAESAQLCWHFGALRTRHQPSRGRWQEMCNWLYSLLPIKRHL